MFTGELCLEVRQAARHFWDASAACFENSPRHVFNLSTSPRHACRVWVRWHDIFFRLVQQIDVSVRFLPGSLCIHVRSCEYKDSYWSCQGLWRAFQTRLWKLPHQSKPVIFGGSIPSWAWYSYLSEATKTAREEVVQPSKAVQLYIYIMYGMLMSDGCVKSKELAGKDLKRTCNNVSLRKLVNDCANDMPATPQ